MSEISVAKNGQATLTCEMPDDTYKGTWIQNGNELANNDRIEIAQNGKEHTLVLKTTLKSDEGVIKFKSDKGDFELDFTLTVTEPPSVDPAEFEECGKSLGAIAIGSPATLKVPFSGASPITVTWRFNDAEIASGDHYKIESTETLTTLVVDNFQNTNCGKYEVTLQNEFGTLKIPVDVSLSESSQVNYEVVQVPGETIEKTTTVEMKVTEPPSKPAGNIKFNSMAENKFSIGLMLTGTPEGVENYCVEKKYDGKDSWMQCALFMPNEAKSVQIKNLKAGEKLTFRIKAINELGESEALESRSITVQKPGDPPVLDAAALKKIGDEIRLKAGKELSLKIPFKGSPQPVAAWTKNGKKMTIKGRYQANTTEKETTFKVSKLTGEDSGEYVLNLKNKEGASTHTFKLIVVDVPGQPQGPMEISDISGSEMTITWQPPRHDGGKPITQYIVDKKEEKQKDWSPVAKVEGEVTTYTVPQLVKGGKYSFRVRAVNEEGESKALTSSPTVASGPPGPCGTPKATDITSKGMKFTWTVPENDGGNEITGYGVEYRENQGDWMLVMKDYIDGLTATLKDLHEESVYECRVCAKNSAGKGKYCESAPTMAMDAPEPPVLDNQCRITYSEPVSLNAGDDLVLKLPCTGIPRPTASWTYGKDEEIKDERASTSAEKGYVLLKLEELKRSDSGTYNVLIENSEGKETMSVNLKVFDVPTEVQSLKAFKTSSKNITVGWQPPKDDGESTLTAYAIEVQCVQDEAHEWIKLNKVFPGEDLKSSYDVKKGNSYIFRVYAINMLGSSPAATTEAILADDKFKPPAAAAAPEVTEVTSKSCVLSWTHPDDNGSPIYGYMVESKRVGRRNWVKEFNGRLVEEATKCMIKNLHKGVEYTFRVIAANEAGFGRPGAESRVIIALEPIPPAPTPTDFVIEDITDRTITFTWKDGEGLERDKLHGYVIQRLGEREEKWVTCNRVPIRGNRAWLTEFRTGEKFKFRISALNEGGLGGFCEIPDLVEIRQQHFMPVVELKTDPVVHVSAGGTLRLSAFVSGKPQPQIKWKKDKIDQERRGATRYADGIAHLNVRYLSKEDTGTFVLTAANKSGMVRKEIKVIVHDAPDPPSNIQLGDMNSDGNLLLKWDPPANDGGSPVKHYCVQMSDAYLKFQTVQDKVAMNQCMVKDLRPGATYYFRVYAENEHGRGEYAQSNLLTVVQKCEPVFISRPKWNRMDTSKPAGFSLMLKQIQIKERRSAKFTCAVIGRPEPEIEWFKDNNKIKANNKYSMKNELGVCSLIINNCRARDCGKYRCIAKNPTGEATCEANLMVYPDS